MASRRFPVILAMEVPEAWPSSAAKESSRVSVLLQALGAKTPAPSIDMKVTSKAATMAALERVGSYGVAVIKELGEEGLRAGSIRPVLRSGSWAPR